VTPVKGVTPVLSTAEAAEILGVSEDTVQRMCQRGELRAYRVGRAWKIRREDLDAYLSAVVNQK
jgi:excisionase family DNA binding protein